MTAYDPTSGELRTHYAGFFDPGFGYDPAGGFRGLTGRARGAGPRRAVHDRARPAGLQAHLRAHARAEPATLYGQGIGSNYQRQDETLGKHFLPRRRRSAGAGRPLARQAGAGAHRAAAGPGQHGRQLLAGHGEGGAAAQVGDGEGHPDHLAGAVDQRRARVAGIDLGVEDQDLAGVGRPVVDVADVGRDPPQDPGG